MRRPAGRAAAVQRQVIAVRLVPRKAVKSGLSTCLSLAGAR
jgi:hypothetical protein